MVDAGAFLKILTTVFTFVEGLIEQVAPVVNKFLDKKQTVPVQPMINPNCQPPQCGEPPYYCPEQQLSPACFQNKMSINNNALVRRTTVLAIMNNNDDNNNKDKSSTPMSPSSTIMLVFVLVIALAIIGFLFIRFNQRNNNRQDFNDRKSSIGSV